MTETKGSSDIDFGPLTGLIGQWEGNKGMDVAPEPEGSEENPFYETIIFSKVGRVQNAESQNLCCSSLPPDSQPEI